LSRRRWGALLLGALLAVGIAGGILVATRDEGKPSPEFPPPRHPVLPDLSVARLSDLTPATGDDGTRKIFFTAAIVNIGDGPFRVHARRHGGGSHWLVTQLFRERDGSTSERVTPADLVWGGHGHNHWHVRLGASYELFRLGARTPLERLRKAGFCFFDQRGFRLSIPTAPKQPQVPRTACAGRGTTDLTMGLSPGWADPYSWLLTDQQLDVTELPDGDYRLAATADPDGWFRESNEHNNRTWVDLRIRKNSAGSLRMKVLGYGPSAGILPPAP
jgi:Lysyl oxidase